MNLLLNYPKNLVNQEILEKCQKALKLNGVNILEENKIIQFEGKKINVEAFELLSKRDPNNPYVQALNIERLNLLKELINNSNALFILNTIDSYPVDDILFLQICSFWSMNKQIILYQPFNKRHKFFNILNSLNVIYFDKFISNLANYAIK